MDHIFVSKSVAISADKCKNDLIPVFDFRSHVFIANQFKFYYGVSFCQPKSQSSWHYVGKITVFIHDPLIPLCADKTVQSFIRKNFIHEFIPLVSFRCNPSETCIENVVIDFNFNTYFGSSLRPEYNFRLISLYTRSLKPCRRSLRESSVGCDIGSNRID